MSKKVPVNYFKWVKDFSEFNEGFIKRYNNECDEGYFLEVKNLHNPHNDLPFLPEIIKVEKVGKLAANLHDKKEYIVLVRNLKKGLNHGLILKKVHRSTEIPQRKHRDMKLVITKLGRNYSELVSKPNYHTTNFFSENLLAIVMKKLNST